MNNLKNDISFQTFFSYILLPFILLSSLACFLSITYLKKHPLIIAWAIIVETTGILLFPIYISWC